MQVRRHAGDAARQDFAALGDEFSQEIRIFVVDRLNGDVDAAAGHRAIGASKSGTAFSGFRLHEQLPRLAVEGMLSQKRIVFLLFQPVRRARTFLISGAHVTRSRFAQRLRLGAFECDDFLRHRELFLRFLSRRLFFFGLATFIIG